MSYCWPPMSMRKKKHKPVETITYTEVRNTFEEIGLCVCVVWIGGGELGKQRIEQFCVCVCVCTWGPMGL